MEIKNFFQKIFADSLETEVPKTVKQKFKDRFSKSKNVEWQKTGEYYEAVFYQNEMEHIVSYISDGSVICLKKNLFLNELPDLLVDAAARHGELMNAIQIECKDEITYELIVRDTELIRYTLLLSVSGKELKKEKL